MIECLESRATAGGAAPAAVGPHGTDSHSAQSRRPSGLSLDRPGSGRLLDCRLPGCPHTSTVESGDPTDAWLEHPHPTRQCDTHTDNTHNSIDAACVSVSVCALSVDCAVSRPDCATPGVRRGRDPRDQPTNRLTHERRVDQWTSLLPSRAHPAAPRPLHPGVSALSSSCCDDTRSITLSALVSAKTSITPAH